MTSDQITGILRAILAAVGGIILSKGWFDASTWAWISGGIVTLAVAGWSIWNNRPAAVAASAQALPGVNVQTTAAASPAVKAAVSEAKATP